MLTDNSENRIDLIGNKKQETRRFFSNGKEFVNSIQYYWFRIFSGQKNTSIVLITVSLFVIIFSLALIIYFLTPQKPILTPLDNWIIEKLGPPHRIK